MSLSLQRTTTYSWPQKAASRDSYPLPVMGNAYGAQGPVMLGITWTEATLALILILLRAKAAAFSPDNNLSAGIFGLRWDFIWVIMAMVTLSPVLTSLAKGLIAWYRYLRSPRRASWPWVPCMGLATTKVSCPSPTSSRRICGAGSPKLWPS